MIRERRRVIKNYMKGWFWFDVGTSLPYDIMFNVGGLSAAKSVKVCEVWGRT
jgi:hypothetical protein